MPSLPGILLICVRGAESPEICKLCKCMLPVCQFSISQSDSRNVCTVVFSLTALKKKVDRSLCFTNESDNYKKTRVLAIFPIEIFLCQHISTNRDRVFGKNATLTSLNITIHHLYPQELPGNAFHS